MKAIFASSKDPDLLYATKTYVSDPALYLETDKVKYIFLDHREFEVFQEQNKNQGLKVVLSNPLLEEATEQVSGDVLSDYKFVYFICQKYDLVNQTIEVPASFPLDLADYLRSKGVNLVVKNPFWPERSIKSSTEVSEIKKNLQRTYEAFAHVENILRASEIVKGKLQYHNRVLTSEFLKDEVDRVLLDHNLLAVEGMIIASGSQSAIPHHDGAGPILPHVPIIVDIFPRNRATGYFADMTRTYVKGKPSEQVKKMYHAVLAAQTQAINLARPDLSIKELHEQTSDNFRKAGFDVGEIGFTHGTGHGLGLELHEVPHISSRTPGELQVGNIVTIEPGLYYPEHGGVRIEDVVLVTDKASENLTNYPKDEFIIP